MWCKHSLVWVRAHVNTGVHEGHAQKRVGIQRPAINVFLGHSLPFPFQMGSLAGPGAH